MLNSAHIQNFRLFKDFQIDDLARVNLIVGKNNAGKSSLLEALYLLSNFNSSRTLFSLLENRGEMIFQEEKSDGDSFLRKQVKWYDISHLFFSRTLKNDTTIELRSGEGANPLKISYVTDKQMHLDFDDSDYMNSQEASLILTNGLNRNVNIPLVDNMAMDRGNYSRIPFLHRSVSNYVTNKGLDYRVLAKLWNSIALTSKEDDIIKMLQIIDPAIERVSFTTRQTANTGIIIKHQQADAPIPLGSMGDGMHRVLTIAMILANLENKVLLIDEIDTGLHYRVLTDVWRVIMKTAVRLNIQVFATTHSWDCVESFTEALEMQENSDVGALFRLERRENDQIAAVKYTADDLAIATKQSIEVR